jgi:beta-glucosidase
MVPEVLYEPNNGDGAPQQDISGLDSDYRHFDMLNITPIYEFGFGLSYTTFDYSNLIITPLEAVPYQPASGSTIPSPTIAAGPIDISNVKTSGHLFPSNIPQYPTFIYPYLNPTKLSIASRDRGYGRPSNEWLPPNSTSSDPQPLQRVSDNHEY